jgi:hypothetical protein
MIIILMRLNTSPTRIFDKSLWEFIPDSLESAGRREISAQITRQRWIVDWEAGDCGKAVRAILADPAQVVVIY